MIKTLQAIIVAAATAAIILANQTVWRHFQKVSRGHPHRTAQALTTEQATQAKQTTQDFFDALGKADWNKIATLCPPGYALGDELNSQQKDELKGVQIISLGEPYKKWPYPGVFVPYGIRFKDGSEKHFNLAVRNDNPEQKWYFDGGF